MSDLILTFFVKDGTIEMNQAIIEMLGRPQQVQICIDPYSCQLLIRACNLGEKQAVIIQDEDQPQIGGQKLIRRISEMAGWPDQEPRYVYGVALPEYHAVFFDLFDTHCFTEI